MRGLRRVVMFGVPSIAVVVAVLIGVWWFFIRSDAHLATDAPAIPTAEKTVDSSPVRALTPGGGVAGEVDYRIDPFRSSASYFVGEKLASLPLPSTAKGTTTVSGVIRLVGTVLAAGNSSTFAAQMTSLTSDQDRRDRPVQNALDTLRYPTANFVAESLTGLPATIPEGEQFDAKLSGKFTLHGVTRER